MSKRSKNRSKRRSGNVPSEPDTSDLIGNTDLSNKDVQVYLVRMPTFLAQQFQNPQHGVIGRLRIPTSQQGNPHNSAPGVASNVPQIFLDKQPEPTKNGQIAVKAYELEIQTDKPNIMIFSGSRTREDPDMKIEGTAMYQCIARPRMDGRYRSVTKARSEFANTHTKQLLRMDDKSRKAAEREALRPQTMMETAKQKEERKRQKEASRRHLDVPQGEWRAMLEKSIFQSFEMKPHYTAEELARAIGEPVLRIRPIMNDVCAYIKSGPFSGRYELKDELKTEKQRQQKRQMLEDHRLAQLEQVRKRKREMEHDNQTTKKSRS
ncbi:General transcription factor IIF subunit 2 [Gracilariopsis chorda]|uniref:General transcription factor IIF subunit 2 n=1 Tax=Gracilariopsis chorda TaxID=448386 RepID=A0A2V3J2B1_9FLOR|nr:General transcription factor IIF subunit 2 [Gracilariopsis chorda]|eukprot:PXF48591.1 General transcription factor IIF subunit 2 [Gracilariopsis chorda]